MRKLATIREIKELLPIEGADRIELAIVDSWKVVVSKGLQVGDKVIYCEIDSFLPIKPEFEFLRKSCYKKLADGSEGFLLRTVKLRGQISQGLCIPLSEIFLDDKEFNGKRLEFVEKAELKQPRCTVNKERITIKQPILNINQAIENIIRCINYDGDRTVRSSSLNRNKFYSTNREEVYLAYDNDVSDILGITKWDPSIGVSFSGEAKGSFPVFLKKTDEERIQNLTKEYQGYLSSNKQFYATEKLDGSSATFYLRDGEFGVCSRNLELKESESNSFWKVARDLQLEEKLKTLPFNACLQGELIGEGIQGNPYKIQGQDIRFFNLFNIDTYEYLSIEELRKFCQDVELVTVPTYDFTLPQTIDELLLIAEGKSALNKDTDREGLVIRSTDCTISFKVISNTFLLMEK